MKENYNFNQESIAPEIVKEYSTRAAAVAEFGTEMQIKLGDRARSKHFNLNKNYVMQAVDVLGQAGLKATVQKISSLTGLDQGEVKKLLTIMQEDNYVTVEYGSPTTFAVNPDILKQVDNGETFIKV